MGCGSSKGSQVTKIEQSLNDTEAGKIKNKPNNGPVAQQKPPSAKKQQVVNEEQKPLKRRPETGVASVSGVAVRNTSATSTKSSDSGIGRESPTQVYKPDSEVDLKPKLSREFVPGRLKEEKIVESLRTEGLTDDPNTKTAKAGLTFEVPLNELKVPVRRPPRRLEKLDLNNKMNFSKEQLLEKLAKAEKKRKEREQEKVQKNREKDTKNLEVKLALLEFEKKKEKDLSRKLSSNLELHAEKRGKLLDVVVERQKLEAKKVDEAKNRKFENSMNLPPEEYEQIKAKQKSSPMNVDDLPVGKF